MTAFPLGVLSVFFLCLAGASALGSRDPYIERDPMRSIIMWGLALFFLAIAVVLALTAWSAS